MKLLNYSIIHCLFFAIFGSTGMVKAQLFPSKNYPQHYFRWPLNIKPELAANFGELRPNHYHMGLDCKTQKKQNLEVLATADGYIARVKIEPYGFGQSIYINHPNGLTTLYAHLNDFTPELTKYITLQQYNQKSWRLFIDIPPALFPVKKGQLIAYSGNTGGSQGPHLHFEIRDTKTDKVLNPLLFGFDIPDKIPPEIFRLAVYDRCLSVYEQNPRVFTVKKVNGQYTTNPPLIIAATDKLSFAISTIDKCDGSTNPNGIYEAILYENEVPVCGFEMDSIGYDETRYLNAHIDYKMRKNGGPFVEHLSQLPGYTHGIYRKGSGDGVINITDDSLHHMKIEVRDPNGNSSLLLFAVQRGIVKTAAEKADTSLSVIKKGFHPGLINVFENNSLRIYLPENALYDSIRFRYNEINPGSAFPVFQLHFANVPVHVYFPVTIKVLNPIGFQNKLILHRWWNSNHDYAPVEKERDGFRASFREFGYFQLMVDTVPPQINSAGVRVNMNCSKLKRIAFVIVDNTEELRNFTALLDNNWIRFSNDKGRTFIYNFDEHCGPGAHVLKISVEDAVGNRMEKLYHFTR